MADSKKVLMVGAGGIGCELLKNLVLTGFNDIDVIDLDTIELSNLNRQFLFQKCHVGKPKAIVARESVLKFNPNVNITAYHDSIFNSKYNVDYFKQFAIVLSALDNKSARSHLNRLCLAADIPLIESGSSGYLGQITLIKKDLTECYDCLPKPPAKTFPGCTIRNTPSEPIHCIVWAKHLFNQLFGSEDPDEAVSPDGEDPENMANAGEQAVKKSTDEDIVVRVSTRQWAKNTNYEPGKLFNKLFNEDIKYLLSMSKLWEKRKAPTPLDWSQAQNDHTIPGSTNENGVNGAAESNTASASKHAAELSSHKIWTTSECCDVLRQSVNALHKRLLESSDDPSGQILCWDKDDEDAMNFVASAANLRCSIFSIPIKSKFEIKSLAGNIIPAIATTNAMVAGLVVIQALKVLNNKLDECRTVYIRDKPSQNKLIVSSELVKPNPKCYVCASKPEVSVKLNTTKFTIKQFETKVLKQELNMIQPDVEIDDGTGRIIISSEEGETEENNDKTLSHFGLTNQSRLKCDDFFQNFEIRITLFHTDELDPQNVKEYEILSDDQTLKDIQAKQESASREEELKRKQQEAQAASNEPDILIEVIDHEKKRTYEAAFDGDEDDKLTAQSVQRKRIKSSETNEILATNQDESGSIDDASDALSDDEEMNGVNDTANGGITATNGDYNQSVTYQLNNQRINDVIQEEDEDCIIEEDEEELGNVSKKLKSNEDDDIIECSEESTTGSKIALSNGNQEDSDIIEINEDKSSAGGVSGSTNGTAEAASESNSNQYSNNLTSPNVSEPNGSNKYEGDESQITGNEASKTMDEDSSQGVTIIE